TRSNWAVASPAARPPRALWHYVGDFGIINGHSFRYNARSPVVKLASTTLWLPPAARLFSWPNGLQPTPPPKATGAKPPYIRAKCFPAAADKRCVLPAA